MDSASHKVNDRLIVFLDILGFKQLVKNKNNHEKLLSTLDMIYNQNSKYTAIVTNSTSKEKTTTFTPTIFNLSDSIILTVPLTDKAYTSDDVPFMLLCLYTSVFYIQLLQHGLALRGALSVGETFLNEERNMILGLPVIEAIEDEANLALNPRIILSESALKKLSKSLLKSNYFYRDNDGMLFIDYFSTYFSLVPMEDDYPTLQMIQASIEKQLNDIIDGSLRIKSKWFWLANYFEQYLAKCLNKDQRYQNIRRFDRTICKYVDRKSNAPLTIE